MFQWPEAPPIVSNIPATLDNILFYTPQATDSRSIVGYPIINFNSTTASGIFADFTLSSRDVESNIECHNQIYLVVSMRNSSIGMRDRHPIDLYLLSSGFINMTWVFGDVSPALNPGRSIAEQWIMNPEGIFGDGKSTNLSQMSPEPFSRNSGILFNTLLQATILPERLLSNISTDLRAHDNIYDVRFLV